jgi:hypothetical protein
MRCTVEKELEQRSNVAVHRCRGSSHSRLSSPHGHLDSKLHVIIADQRSNNLSNASTESTYSDGTLCVGVLGFHVVACVRLYAPSPTAHIYRACL